MANRSIKIYKRLCHYLYKIIFCVLKALFNLLDGKIQQVKLYLVRPLCSYLIIY